MESNQTKVLRILIAESDPNLRNLYSEYLGGLGLYVVAVKDGNQCLSDYREKYFDMVILDTHLSDIAAFDVAKKIRQIKPNQKIVLTTTHSLPQIVTAIQSFAIDKEYVLVKPSNLSTLHDIMRKVQ